MEYKFAWNNVGNVPTDVPRFIERYPRITQMLRDINADILGLTELRDEPDLPIQQFLTNVCGSTHSFLTGRNDVTPKQFNLGVCYNKSKFYAVCSNAIPIAVGDPVPRILFCVKFAPIINGKIYYDGMFYIVLSHLHIKETLNRAQCHWIVNNIDTITEHLPYIIMMDANWFRDDHGLEHANILLETHYDYGELFVEADSNRPMISTFSGFINDNFRNRNIYQLTNECDTEGNLVAYPQDLDHILTSRRWDWRIHNQKIVTTPYAECDNKLDFHNFPTDHFPLTFECILPELNQQPME